MHALLSWSLVNGVWFPHCYFNYQPQYTRRLSYGNGNTAQTTTLGPPFLINEPEHNTAGTNSRVVTTCTSCSSQSPTTLLLRTHTSPVNKSGYQ